MTLWAHAPKGLKEPPRNATPEELRAHIKLLTDALATTVKDLEFIINGNIDNKNIRALSITADMITVTGGGSLQAELDSLDARITALGG